MSNLAEAAEQAREKGDVNILIDAIPYAKTLGIQADHSDDLVFVLMPRKSNIGNPTLPALHGGAVGGFLEMVSSLHLIMAMDVAKMPKVVDFSIDYLRPGLFKELYARCTIQKFGNKLVNIAVDCWQEEEGKSIAKARVQFLID
ncbi:MAG: PaaI family thioesterase [Candidatus Pelagadaptatus aseana]|uniref:PaaI family thioesterase n=1 Tax=Candidatus Pelagadaptatus aseana TaxID=3120508 RepID=UPI0039B1CA30